MPRLELGRTLITPGALNSLPPEEIIVALARHARGDWGDLTEEDQGANDRALVHGARILSAYHASNSVKFWIITEWDRSATTILLPEEY